MLDLSRREAALLEELLHAAGRIVVKDTLEERLYALDQPVTGNALEAIVSRVRKKLAAAHAGVRIDTKRGVGYRLLAVGGVMRLQSSLRWRLMVAMLIVFGLGLGASAIFSYGEAYGTLKELRKRTLQGQAQELLAALRFRGDGGVEVALPAEWENAYRRLDKSFAYSVYDVK